MAIVLRSTASGSAKTTGTTVVLSSASVLIGDIVVVAFTTMQTAFAGATVADNLGHTWTAVTPTLTNDGIRMYAWTTRATVAGSLVATITHTSTNVARAAVASVFGGVRTLAGAIHGTVAFAQDNKSPFSTTSMGAASEIGELAVGIFGLRGPNGDVIAASSPHTLAIKLGTTGAGETTNCLAALTWYLTANAVTAVQPTITDTKNRTGLMAGFFARGLFAGAAYTAAGQPAGLRVTRKLTAAPAAYVETGQDADAHQARIYGDFGDRFSNWNLGFPVVQLADTTNFGYWLAQTQSPVVQFMTISFDGPTPLITTTPGSYTVTANAATFRHNYALQAAPGAYAVTGQNALFTAPKRMPVEVAEYLVDGADARFIRTYLSLVAAPGAYHATGQSANFRVTRAAPCAPGAYVVTGQDAAFHIGVAASFAPGSYVVTGQQADLHISGTPSLIFVPTFGGGPGQHEDTQPTRYPDPWGRPWRQPRTYVADESVAFATAEVWGETRFIRGRPAPRPVAPSRLVAEAVAVPRVFRARTPRAHAVALVECESRFVPSRVRVAADVQALMECRASADTFRVDIRRARAEDQRVLAYLLDIPELLLVPAGEER